MVLVWVLEELPLFIVYMVVIYFALDLLLPNHRKFGKIIGVICFELFEHIFLPLSMILVSIVVPM